MLWEKIKQSKEDWECEGEEEKTLQIFKRMGIMLGLSEKVSFKQKN